MLRKGCGTKFRNVPKRTIPGGNAKDNVAGKYFLDQHLIKLWKTCGHKFGYACDFAEFASKNRIGSRGTNSVRLKKLADAGIIKFTSPKKVTNAQARKLILGKLKGKRYKNRELAVRELFGELSELNSKLIKTVLNELLEDGIVPVEQIATDVASQTKLRKSIARKRTAKE